MSRGLARRVTALRLLPGSRGPGWGTEIGLGLQGMRGLRITERPGSCTPPRRETRWLFSGEFNRQRPELAYGNKGPKERLGQRIKMGEK